MIKFFVFLALAFGGVYYWIGSDTEVVTIDDEEVRSDRKVQTIVEMADYLDKKEKTIESPTPEEVETAFNAEADNESQRLDEVAVQAFMDGQAVLENSPDAVAVDDEGNPLEPSRPSDEEIE